MARRSFLASLAGFGSACFGVPANLAAEVKRPTMIQFSLDRPINAGAAPLVMAAADGLYGSESLSVTTDIANGSSEAIGRVARGASDAALIDVNELIRFRGRRSASIARSIKCPRISGSRNDRRRRTFSTMRSCLRSAAA